MNIALRVLQVAPDLTVEYGGPARSTVALGRALARAGCEVTLYAAAARGKAIVAQPGKDALSIHIFRSGPYRLSGALQISNSIRKHWNEFDIVLVHTLWNPVSTLAARAAASSGIPYVISPQGMLNRACLMRHSTRKRLYAALYDSRTVERAACVRFLNSTEALESGASWLSLPMHFIAPNGVDVDEAAQKVVGLRERYPDLANRKIVLYLGRLHPIKRLTMQLSAVAALTRIHPEIIWVLVGPDENEWRNLTQAAATLGVTHYVRWLGPILGAERFGALRDADVVLQSSLHEAHSMAVNEALAVGVPLVITKSVRFDEVEACGAGRVVDNSAEALAAGIHSVLQNPEQGRLMRLAGRRFAVDRLSWAAVASTVVSEMQSVLDRRHPQFPDRPHDVQHRLPLPPSL